MNTTKTISRMNLDVGHIAHFHGARFEITNTRMTTIGNDPVIVANGKWLDGEIINGYFGPKQDWSFQGNQHATVDIEA